MRRVWPIVGFENKFPVSRFLQLLPNRFHYEQIKLLFEKLLCMLTCHGEVIGLELDVTAEETVLRQPDPLARKTVINNKGPGYVRVFEEHKLVAIIGPMQSRTLPMNARLLLTAQAETIDTVVFITTYQRCLCGDDPPLPYAGSEPIGGTLI